MHGKNKLKSKKTKANGNELNLNHNNDIAIPNVENNYITNVTAQQSSTTNVIQKEKNWKMCRELIFNIISYQIKVIIKVV